MLERFVLLALYLLPFVLVTEISRIACTASAPAGRKTYVAASLGLWRPWLYAPGIIAVIAGSSIDMPWKAVLYAGVMLAIALATVLLAVLAKAPG